MQVQTITRKGFGIDPDEIRQVEVPDGQWVAESRQWSYREPGLGDARLSERRTNQIIGLVRPDSHLIAYGHKVTAEASRTWEKSLIVSAQPFGVVVERDARDQLTRRLVVSRQVHRGAPRRLPMIKMPEVVQAGTAHVRNPYYLVVRLDQLASQIGMTARETVLRYFQFAADERNSDERYSNDLGVFVTEDPTQPPFHPRGYRIDDIGELFEGSRGLLGIQRPAPAPDKIWVEARWAKRVLYMAHFGYVPKPIELPSARESDDEATTEECT